MSGKTDDRLESLGSGAAGTGGIVGTLAQRLSSQSEPSPPAYTHSPRSSTSSWYVFKTWNLWVSLFEIRFFYLKFIFLFEIRFFRPKNTKIFNFVDATLFFVEKMNALKQIMYTKRFDETFCAHVLLFARFTL